MTERAKRKSLDALSDAELADAFGDLDARRDKLGEQLKPIKDEFDRRKLDHARGERWKVTKDVKAITRFDTKAAKAALGKEAAKYEMAATRTEWIVREVEAA